jgi:Holliday junction resolvase
MTNKKLGNTFETELCELLYAHGFWCHNMAQNSSGQPADVIAVKDHKAYLIDCKVCSKGWFALDRMEENQDLSMELWRDCGNGEGWFAVKVNDQIFMIPHFSVKAVRNVQSSMSETEIYEYGTPLERWLKKK